MRIASTRNRKATMNEQLQQLERDGYTIFRDFLDCDTTARIREHMDSLLPPIAAREAEDVPRVHDLRHPIPGAIMAEIAAHPKLLEVARETLCANDLRLLEQVLIRTDPQNAAPGANGWHIDMAFLPQHSEARPRQTYFHMVHALNTVPQNGGATFIVPGSHHTTYAAAKKLGSVEALSELKKDPIGVAKIDVREAMEVCPDEGDLLVFNPMCLHSASPNRSETPRYVYFASFKDASAEYLDAHLKAANYNKGFPDSLRDNLPRELQSLLN